MIFSPTSELSYRGIIPDCMIYDKFDRDELEKMIKRQKDFCEENRKNYKQTKQYKKKLCSLRKHILPSLKKEISMCMSTDNPVERYILYEISVEEKLIINHVENKFYIINPRLFVSDEIFFPLIKDVTIIVLSYLIADKESLSSVLFNVPYERVVKYVVENVHPSNN